MPSIIRGDGTSEFGGNVSIAGTLSYEDVTSIDSVGVITARSGIDVGTGTSIFSPSSNVLTLGTNNGERLRITSNGSIGTKGLIPTDGTFAANSTIRSQNASSNISYIGFSGYTGNTTVGSMFSYMGGDGRNTGYLNFSTNDTERLRILSNGNVGIGSTIPSEKLTVNGRILSGADRQATLGASFLDGYYDNSNVLNTFGSQYSSAKTTLGFAVRPKEGSEGFVSSSNASAVGRAVVDFDAGSFEYKRADSQSVALGNNVGLTTVFRAGSTGNIQRPQQCYVAVGAANATLSFTGSGSTSFSPWGASSSYEFVDRNGDWDTSTQTFTAPVDGIYQFNIGFRYSSISGTVAYIYMTVTVDGGGAANGGQRFKLWSPGTESGGTYRSNNFSGAVYMTEGQTIQPLLKLSHSTSGTINFNPGSANQADSYFDIYLVG